MKDNDRQFSRVETQTAGELSSHSASGHVIGREALRTSFDILEKEAVSRRIETITYASHIPDPDAERIVNISKQQINRIFEGGLSLDDIQGTHPNPRTDNKK